MNSRHKNVSKMLMGLLVILLLTSGCSLSDLINPKPNVTAVELSRESVTLEVGQSVTLSATVYGDPNQGVVWQTDDSRIATVTYGEVSGVAPGEARITAFSPYDPSKSDSATITVVPAN